MIMEYHATSLPCPLKGQKAPCFAMERGRCRLLKEFTRAKPCAFYKTKTQYEEEVAAADKRAWDRAHNTGIRSYGKIERSEAYNERERS